MGYPPGQQGYCVRSLATNHFFTSGSVIFDENIPYNAIHSAPSSKTDYSTLPNSLPPLPLTPADPGPLPSLPPEPQTTDNIQLENASTSSPPPSTPPCG